MVLCKFCGSDFTNEKSLGQHRKLVHPDDGYPCPTCDQVFKNRQARYRHHCPSSEKTDIDSRQSAQLSDINCGICDLFFPSMETLCSHLDEIHRQPGSIRHLSFDDTASYTRWKLQVESDGRFQFHLRQKRNGKAATTEYWYCHRSGCDESISEGKRAPKKLRSIKVGYSCSCFAVVKVFNDNRVTVKCCLDHYMHDNRLACLRIPNEVKKQIAQYYDEGRTASWIVNKLRSDISLTSGQLELCRQNIITHQEVYNVVSLLGIRKEQFDKDDAISVELLIEHHNSKATSAGELPPFFCFQRQDSENEVFTLGIQTSFQLEMLQTFGRRAICVDATHGTQRYKFLLVTVLVVDDFGKGFPAAWLVTSNENQDVLTRFFSALKERTGQFECDVFMSDDAPQYYNSWIAAFAGQDDSMPPRKLLCVWHVLRNWRKNLLSNVKKENVVMVWSRLAIILREPDKAIFHLLLSKFMTELQECEADFGKYFRREYASSEKRIGEWAFWARKGSIVNVNMYLEAFHRTLKKKFLNRNENHRMDFVLARLFDASIWYLQEYAVAVERGGHENNYRIKEMHDRHRKSNQFQQTDVTSVGRHQWKIKASSKDEQYDIVRIKTHCDCQLRCQYCTVCPDIYDCSCPNALFGSIACKHIHFIHSTIDQSLDTRHGDLTSETSIIDPELEGTMTNSLPHPPTIDLTRIFQHVTVPTSSIGDQKAKIHLLMKSIGDKIESIGSVDVVNEVLRKLSQVDAYASIYSQRSLPVTSTVVSSTAPNKKMAIQPRLFQVRKKTRRTQVLLGRPDDATVEAIRDNFDHMESEVCASCLQEEPPGERDNKGGDVEWISCDVCKNWYHQMCAVWSGAAEVFICKNCPRR